MTAGVATVVLAITKWGTRCTSAAAAPPAAAEDDLAARLARLEAYLLAPASAEYEYPHQARTPSNDSLA